MKILKKMIKILVLACCLMATSIVGPEIHETYLVNSKGKSIVKLFIPGKGSGTGFQIRYANKDLIISNRHVCEIGKSFMYAKTYKGISIVKILKKSEDYDLCILQGIKEFPSLELAFSYSGQQKVYTVGHPLGLGKTIVSGRIVEAMNVTLGIDCEDKRKKVYKKVVMSFFGPIEACFIDFMSIRISNVTFPGNSGSPVLNMFGNVVGVIFAGRNGVENLGFMVPLQHLKVFLGSK